MWPAGTLPATLASSTPLPQGHMRHPDPRLGPFVIPSSLPLASLPLSSASQALQGCQKEMDREYGPGLVSVHSGPALNT